MGDLRETFYCTVITLWTVGIGLGLLYIPICPGERIKKKGLFFKVLYPLTLLSFALCWIFLLMLFLTLPKFSWFNSILQPPLLLIVALSLWQIAGGLRKTTHKIKTKTLVIVLNASIFVLVGLQFFNIYGSTL